MRGDSPLRAEQGEHVVDLEGEQVVLAYDPDGEVWCVLTSSVPGLAAEAETLDRLIEDLPRLIRQARVP